MSAGNATHGQQHPRPMDNKKLFLLDAYALIYRAYYALIRAPRFTAGGLNTSAVFGFCNTLDEVLRKMNPTHIAVCFDPKGKTFRHEMYDGYKAQREAQPEDIQKSVPIIKEIIEAYDIPIFEVPGYEADDVIGTLATKAAAQGFTTYMMTPDKDFGQLVTDSILQYRPSLAGKDFEIRGPREVCERYGISSPRQVIDLLALEGDTIDNIPGCPGVGPKTATKLIAEYHDIDNMLAHADGIKGALGQRIRDNADQIRFSKDLATIRTDAPIEVDFDKLARGEENVETLAAIYSRLEFKTFLQRLKGRLADPDKTGTPAKGSNIAPKNTAIAAESQPSLFDFIETPAGDIVNAPSCTDLSTADYAPADTPEEIALAVQQASGARCVGLALYATGEEAMTARLRGIALSWREGTARLVTLPPQGPARHKVMAMLQPLLANPGTLISSTDIKRDMVILRREGIELSAPYFDISLAHYILQPEMRHRLSDIASTILNHRTDDYDDPAATRKTYGPVPPGREIPRLCEQADLSARLVEPLRTLLRQNDQTALLDDIELPLARVLAEMEWTGVRIDTAELRSLSKTLTARLNDIENQAYELAGRPFNIGSPMQVGEILFGHLKLDPKAKRTKTGAYSTTEEILEKHRHSHPVVGLILQARSLKKLLATYVNALPEMVNRTTGKIHTTYNQTVTATGRISSANPNLQNIPVRTDEGREVRRAFIADPGCLILSADYSQIELRLLADLSADPELTEAFLSGEDIHRATAAKIFHVPLAEVTDQQRRVAKTANFGTIYGISAFGLSERLGIPRPEAKELIATYFATYPHIRQHIATAVEEARKNGYVTTVMGRKRYLPDINSRNGTVRSFAERNAVNAPLQGSAADIIKIAMIRIHAAMSNEGMRSRMIMQVHDELIFNVVPDELPRLQVLVTENMTHAFDRGPVPLEVSAGVGRNWLEAH